MNKNAIYEKVIEYAKANDIKFVVVKNDEIDPAMDLNGYNLLDTNLLELPCTFAVDKAVILCIDTPMDMTPEDTGESYQDYWNTICNLKKIQKPQYVALDGAYIKLMCWCDWMGEEDPKRDFLEACRDALELIKDNEQYTGCPIDFRLFIDKDVTPFIFSCSEIDKMWDFVKNIVDWDIEIYANFPDENMAETTDHGIESHKNSELLIIKAY
ncbi:MAG: hypothetical protein II453_18425 [Alphaproteobacteria bacterium]|nr:hypothetical protein [Alphaproteobacteria bacterium]